MLCTPQIKNRVKIIIGIIVGLAVIGGLLALLLKYLGAFTELSQVTNKNPVQEQAVDLVQLANDYRAKSAKILNDFLAAAAVGNADLATSAKQVQNELLALNLPAEYRDRHLKAVLLLGEIANLAGTGQTAALSDKFNELKQLAGQ